MLRSDLAELLPDDPRVAARAGGDRDAGRVAGPHAGLDGRRRWPTCTGVAQPHCHQHAVLGWDADAALLAGAGAQITAVGGCCGLAGNFGVERGHYDVSVAVAETALLPAVRSLDDGGVVLADGFSCRTQLDQLAGRRGPAPGRGARREVGAVTACSRSSRRPTRTTASTRSSRSRPSTTAARSTCRSARRSIRRCPRCSRRSRRAEGVRGYPSSIGSAALRQAAADWLDPPARVGRARPGDRGRGLRRHEGVRRVAAAVPAAARPVPRHDPVPGDQLPDLRDGGDARRLPGGAVPVASTTSATPTPTRALAIWVNSPSNPTGELSDLAAAARWGRERDVLVVSDECYAEYTWTGAPTTILADGAAGVLAVHSLSKRDNFAGARVGFYAGDPEVVYYLEEVRKHAGLMVAGPVQAAAVVALQRRRARRGAARALPDPAAGADRAARRGRLPGRAARRRVLPLGARRRAATPGRRPTTWPSGPASSCRRATSTAPCRPDYFRVAAVQPDERIALAAGRLSRWLANRPSAERRAIAATHARYKTAI